MAAGEAIGCFGLTEPDAGSDPGSMRTRARRDGSDWILHGQKMWITNGSVSEVAVVWAQTDEGVRGFLVPKGTKGFTTQDIHSKLSLRASITSELLLDDVRLPGRRGSARGELAEGTALLPQRGALRDRLGRRRGGVAPATKRRWSTRSSGPSSTARSPPSRSSSRSWRRWCWR